ncbi:Rha family transcriptional regulator [Agrobacterium sp. FDAARGOS_525]|uniref:Rha family transcriptional regulator n=1 Tax=Agrobacterium sp. FDAARGOS_525 TaxID=2420311 RepID=UPI00256F341E|nr:Rha family transcriptional regulator [Agrobacterium sp. FDAARGOS_525]
MANKSVELPVVANSLDVAAYFGKRHDNVVRDIENLFEQDVLNFEEAPYTNEQNGQTYRAFDMTRDGFTLLAMGFTGAKALRGRKKSLHNPHKERQLTP